MLSWPNPTSQAVFSGEDGKMLNRDTGPFRLSELADAIKKLKRCKAEGKARLRVKCCETRMKTQSLHCLIL